MKDTQALQQGKPLIKNLSRTAGVSAGGGAGKGSTANKPQRRHNGKANLCRNTDANSTRENSCQPPPATSSPADDAIHQVIEVVPPAGLPIEQVLGEYSLS